MKNHSRLILNLIIINITFSQEPCILGDVYISEAANAGDPEAQFQLGQLHFKGIDGAIDLVQAYKWLTLAKDAGHVLAEAERDSISQNMKNDQIIAAKRLARKFEPVNSEKD